MSPGLALRPKEPHLHPHPLTWKWAAHKCTWKWLLVCVCVCVRARVCMLERVCGTPDAPPRKVPWEPARRSPA